MKKLLIIVAIAASAFASDIIVKNSSCAVGETVTNLKHLIRNKGLDIFDTINHGSNARLVDMKLGESELLIFGDPRLGTALMREDMTAGLDLPLRILVYRDNDGKVKIAYRDGSWLEKNHALKSSDKTAKVTNVMDKFTTEAGQCEKE
jgi:uncharacterized protein (DUF302 family)